MIDNSQKINFTFLQHKLPNITKNYFLAIWILFNLFGTSVRSQDLYLKTVSGINYRFNEVRQADVVIDTVPHPWHIDITELFIVSNVADKLWFQGKKARALEIYRSVARLRCETVADQKQQLGCNALKPKILEQARKRVDQDGLTYRQTGNYFVRYENEYLYGNEEDGFSLNLRNPIDSYSTRDISKLEREIFLTAGADKIRIFIFSEIPADVRGSNFARYLLQRTGVAVEAQKAEIIETQDFRAWEIESYLLQAQKQVQIKFVRWGNKGFMITSQGNDPGFRLLGFGY